MTEQDARQAADDALLAAFRAGDHDAFAELFTRHRDRLWAVALRTTGNREDAADALQEAMVAAYRRAASFRGDAQVGTWLHRIVVNACLDRIRRARVRAAEPLPDDLEDAAARGALVAAPGGPASDPEGAVLAAEQRGVVLAALAELPAEQRAALVLVDVQGYSVEEAAAVLQCAPGTVKSRCSRGRRRLAGLLAPLREGTGTAPSASHREGTVGGGPGPTDRSGTGPGTGPGTRSSAGPTAGPGPATGPPARDEPTGPSSPTRGGAPG